MTRLLVPIILIFLLAGCATRVDPTRPISRDLPLSYTDLAEIKQGFERHKETLKTYQLYHQPELNLYLTTIGKKLVFVSERPRLPHQFFVLDDDRVDLFSVGGGYVYVTRGMLEFVGSEAELAAVLAHEIAHVASGAYTPSVEQKLTKKQMFLKALKLGAGAAAGAAGSIVGGPAGSIASGAAEGVNDAIPEIRKQFQKSEELVADRRAFIYLEKANYDPRELGHFLDRLSKVKIADILTYINYLNSHPPYEERRTAVKEMIAKTNFKTRTFELREERYASIRMVTMHFDKVKASASEKLVSSAPIETKPVS